VFYRRWIKGILQIATGLVLFYFKYSTFSKLILLGGGVGGCPSKTVCNFVIIVLIIVICSPITDNRFSKLNEIRLSSLLLSNKIKPKRLILREVSIIFSLFCLQTYLQITDTQRHSYFLSRIRKNMPLENKIKFGVMKKITWQKQYSLAYQPVHRNWSWLFTAQVLHSIYISL